MWQWLERLAWRLGFGAVGVFAVLAFADDAAKARFEASQETRDPGSAAGMHWSRPGTARRSDWSESRIDSFFSALTEGVVPEASGVLRIPAVEVEAPIFDDTSEKHLNLGVGRISGTADLGESGNLGLAGHRDGYFRRLQDIATGDLVHVERHGGTQTYRVTETRIVRPTAVEVIAPTGQPTITLVTCYPFYFLGHAPKRFIVKGTRVDQPMTVSAKEAT